MDFSCEKTTKLHMKFVAGIWSGDKYINLYLPASSPRD